MINVAIVDDECLERQQIRNYLEEIASQNTIQFCIDEFSSADTFLLKYEQGYDLVFMDIEFKNGQNGMQVAHALRQIDNTMILIFVTNMAQMAIEGYEVEALDFIVKPVDRYAFMLKMTRALNRVAQNTTNCITVRQEGDVRSLHVHLIRYLTVNGHYVVYHSREGIFTEYISLSAAIKKLNSPIFYRCDRGCVVNLRFVNGIKKDTCVVDGEELLIARTQRAKFLKAYTDFLGGLRKVEK